MIAIKSTLKTYEMDMRKKVQVISVSPENRNLLAKAHGSCLSAVYNALSGRSNSDKSKLIRQDALQNYGGVVINKYIWE